MNLEYEFSYRAGLKPTLPVGAAPYGTRLVVEVTGGSFEGKRLKGTILTGGADWLLVGPDGYGRLDVRLTLHTHDGASIYVQYFGLIEYTDAAHAANAGERSSEWHEHYFRTCPRLETGDPRYEWVNRTLFVAQGRLHPGPVVEYQVFRVT